MKLIFPDTIQNYRKFFEQLASAHRSINHDAQNRRNRFSEIMYLDFPMAEYELKYWANSIVSELDIDPQGDEAAVCILTQDVMGYGKLTKNAQASVIIYKKFTPNGSNRNREEMRNRIIDECELICEDFKYVIEEFFKKGNKGTILDGSWTTAPTKLPTEKFTYYGMRLDFKYSIKSCAAGRSDQVWKEVFE